MATPSPSLKLMVLPVNNISDVAAHNELRAQEGKNLALVVYAIAGLTLVLISLFIALLVAWRTQNWLSAMPYANDGRVATFYWWYAFISIAFLLSCAGGTVTAAAILLTAVVVVLAILLDVVCNCRKRCTERHRPADRGGRTLAAAARIEWLVSDGLRGLTEEQIGGRAGIVGGVPINSNGGNSSSGSGGSGSGGKASSTGKAESTAGLDPRVLEYLELDKQAILGPTRDPNEADPQPQHKQRDAVSKINAIVKTAREGGTTAATDRKRPWAHYPDRNPDGSPSDKQIALEEAAAWKVRRAFGDRTEMTEGGGLLRDADSGVIPGSKMETAMRLARTLMRYSPGSLRNMEHILDNYQLQEDRLFSDLAARYGPEPARIERKKWAARQRQRGQLSSDQVAAALTVPELPSDMYWTRCPVRPVPPQLAAMVICFVFIVLCACAMYASVQWWPLQEYRVIQDVPSNATAGVSVVSIPEPKIDLVAKAEFLIYGWPGAASEMRVSQYTDLLSKLWYRYVFYRELTSDADKAVAIKEQFIDTYSVDMSPYVDPSYTQYRTVDDWWGRVMDMRNRPLAPGWRRTGVIIAPSDGRITAFSNVQRARRFWVKGGRFSFAELVNGKEVDRVVGGNLNNYFAGGSLLLARLAVADYHRFHAPVSGRVVDMWEISKNWLSNTPTAVQSGNNVLFNTRWIVLIDTTNAAANVPGVVESPPASLVLEERRRRQAAAAAATTTTAAAPANATQRRAGASTANAQPQASSPPSMGIVAMIIIGSTMAGSVELTHRNYTAGANTTSRNGTALAIGQWVRAGDELGRFHLGGSTIALVFRPGAAKFKCSVLERSALGVETKVDLGMQIGVNQGTEEGLDSDFCI